MRTAKHQNIRFNSEGLIGNRSSNAKKHKLPPLTCLGASVIIHGAVAVYYYHYLKEAIDPSPASTPSLSVSVGQKSAEEPKEIRRPDVSKNAKQISKVENSSSNAFERPNSNSTQIATSTGIIETSLSTVADSQFKIQQAIESESSLSDKRPQEKAPDIAENITDVSVDIASQSTKETANETSNENSSIKDVSAKPELISQVLEEQVIEPNYQFNEDSQEPLVEPLVESKGATIAVSKTDFSGKADGLSGEGDSSVAFVGTTNINDHFSAQELGSSNSPIESVENDNLSNQIKKEYFATIKTILEKNKRYPKIAKKKRQTGIATVQFKISSSGLIYDEELISPTEFRLLNKEAVSVLGRVKQLPPIPLALELQDLIVELPISFTLKKGV